MLTSKDFVSFLALFGVSFHCVLCKSWSREMTVLVEATKNDCYFLPNVTENHDIQISFTVVGSPGTTGNLDISLHFLDPSKVLLYSVPRSSVGKHLHRTTEYGDYQICMDNSYSSFANKVVFLDVTIVDASDDYYDDYLYYDDMKRMRQMDRDELHFTLEDVQEALHSIRAYIRDISHIQASFMATDSQDLNMMAKNAQQITMWSSIHLAFLVVIGLIQVLMVKSLFSDKSFMYKMWQRMR